ncbi:MAG: drug/metabolite transporter (DMT)-like permease [Ilumatobacter sp.]|jgi:drug/metabolite transporter (DMT)-like permease
MQGAVNTAPTGLHRRATRYVAAVTATTQTSADSTAASETPRGLLGAGMAVTAWSTGTILAKYLDMDALAIGTYRFFVFFVGITFYMHARGVPFKMQIIRKSMWGGIALGADIVFFFSAIKETSVVNATTIGSLQPILVGVVAARFFGEKIRLRDALWSLVALAGAFVVVTSSTSNDVTSLRGDLLAVAAMFSWSAYFIASKNSRSTMTSTEFTAGTSIWTAAICLVIGLPLGQDLSWPNASNWGWLILMILGSGIVGHSLMNWSLQRIPLWVGSTFTLFIPVASAALAWLILDEAVSALQGIAMACVIGALAMIVRGQTKPGAKAAAKAAA